MERAVGRRTVVRYGMVGLLGMAAAACGSGGGKSDKAADGSVGPAGAPPTTLAGHAVEAFVRGTWNLSITPKPNYDYTTLTVADGRWSMTTPPEAEDGTGTPRIREESGAYSLAAGALTVTKDEDTDTDIRATGVPGQVADSAKATVTWMYGEERGARGTFPVDVTWDGTTLTARRPDAGRGEDFVLKATRA
ncbi:hypothetical protein ACPA54_33465 [Uniformispora flossi]|uniref:hypothetical protein n=1 Tax=Uniformispora flossi TaxID=3390723 RepID=UPI003C2DF3DC